MKHPRSRGSSLLEVLSAVSLFSIVASAIGALATQSMVHTVLSRHATAATMLAQRELEDLRGLPYDDIVSRASSASVGGQAFAISTGVAPDSPADGMKHIAVTVGWTGPEGSKSYVLETIFTSVTG